MLAITVGQRQRRRRCWLCDQRHLAAMWIYYALAWRDPATEMNGVGCSQRCARMPGPPLSRARQL